MKDSLRLMSWDMHPYSPTPIVEDYETFNITLDQSRTPDCDDDASEQVD